MSPTRSRKRRVLRRRRRDADRTAPGALFAAADRAGLPVCRCPVQAIRRLGAAPVVLGPGSPGPGRPRLADLTDTFKGHWSAYATEFTRPARTGRHPPDRFRRLVHGIPEALVPLAVRTAHERGAAVCWPVTGEPPDPWPQLASALSGAGH
ncbi:hypothetical protein [Streptomyces sp. CoH27]|uniref:hypothetical protein n=1 Tax=Streptomyces sp. CoH27 TaxID=2875763 RepID=UPI0027E174A8|nr:hypothetical protein [Streptomyces sp. CoH27]